MNIDKRFYNKALGDKNKNPLTFLPAIQTSQSQETHTNLAEDFATISYVNESLTEFSPLFEGPTTVQDQFFGGHDVRGIRAVNGDIENVLGVNLESGQERIEITSLKLNNKGNVYSRIMQESANVTLESFEDLERVYMNFNGSGNFFVVGGPTGFEGIKYVGDYSNDYTTRSLVDKAYVDARALTAGFSTYFEENFGDEYKQTFFSSSQNNGEGSVAVVSDENDEPAVQISYTDTNIVRYGTARIDSSGVGLSTRNVNINNSIDLFSGSGAITIVSDDSSTDSEISMTGNTIVIGGSGSFPGLQYEQDFSANYTDQSLVDKAYVNSLIEVGSTDFQDDLFDGFVGPRLRSRVGDWESSSTVYSDDIGAHVAVYNLNDNRSSYTAYSSGSTIVGYQGLTNGTYFQLSENNIALSAPSSGPGIQYDNDHSANYVDRSLVDKAYVDRKLGWAVYGDSQYTDVSPLSIGVGVTTTVDIDGLGNTITTYLPSDTTDFYDTATSKITPTNIGDGYTFTLSFKGSSSSNNGSATIGVDIGGAVGEIFRRSFRFPRGIGETHEFYMTSQGYSLDTFVANGGIIKITSDVGTSEIWDVALQVHRTYRAES